jgi:putative PIN family toxin of toxin-antitoxin system
MKILLDTNVLIAAFITHGVCNELLEHCLRRHQIIISEFLLNEFQTHLVHKFHYNSREIREAVELLRVRITVVIPVPLSDRICRDADDDQVLGTALAGQVDCLVTGDKDLLDIKQFLSIPIIKPSEFSEFEGSFYG